MINLWGTERSTRHATYVTKVRHYLQQKCGREGAVDEIGIVTERLTDVVGHDKKSKTWYLCEVKVNWTDFQKAPYQIYDTAFRFPKNPRYHKGDRVIPVIAIPATLQKELIEHDNWNSLCELCKNSSIAIWVVEQSTVREIMSPKTKVVKTKSAGTKAVKTKRPKTKTSGTKTVKPRKRSVKSSKAKKPKTKSTKRKTSRATVAKTGVARKKS